MTQRQEASVLQSLHSDMDCFLPAMKIKFQRKMSPNKKVHSRYVYKGKLKVRAPRNLSNGCHKEGGAPLVPWSCKNTWILKQPTKLKPSSRAVSKWIRHENHDTKDQRKACPCATLTGDESQCDSYANLTPGQCDPRWVRFHGWVTLRPVWTQISVTPRPLWPQVSVTLG